jgi:hypothetical protein
MNCRLHTVLGVILLLALARPACAAGPVWEPQNTWVFAVGVIKFDNPKTVGWPEEGRADVELLRALEKRGVSRERILFLKNEEATRDNIVKEFGPFLKRAGADDTLLLYYAGHGSRNYANAGRPCTFMTYDTASGWPVNSIFNTVAQNFRGRQVMYTADCCHSGSLVVQSAQQGQSGSALAAGALTSSHVSSTSTGNWTFTRSLIRMLDGDAALDFSGDGKITFAEASRFVTDEMALAEGQYAANGTSGGFSPDTVMSLTNGSAAAPRGTLVEGEWQGKWWKAMVLEEKDGQVFVTWPGWSRKYDMWLPKSRTRAYAPKLWPVGARVEVEWRKQWWPARILTVERGLHFVHYDGFPESDDEWVRAERVRERQQ